MKTNFADYVIVGGGTAGCVLAARLSENPLVSVIMLEAGPRYRGLFIQMPAGFGALYEKGKYHWPYKSNAEPFAANKVLPYKMGRVVGGSSAINGLVWARGNVRDYDDWRTSGCSGWGYSDIEPLFRRIEAFEDPSDTSMGQNGPIPVMRGRPEKQVLSDAFLKAAALAGYQINPNHNSGGQEGFCALHRNTHKGRRGDVYQGYIHPIRRRKNLTILSGHTVFKLEMEGKTVTGVLSRQGSTLHRFTAKNEVILSAGSVASPQLLELSGIGNRKLIEAQGITTLHDLPGVGENLHTHPTIALTFSCKTPDSILTKTKGVGKILAGIRWFMNRTGPAATNHFEAGAFLKSRAGIDRPDYQLTFLPLALAGTVRAIDSHGFQVYVELVGCKSRGQVHIASSDINVQPEFCFNFLKDCRDLEVYKQAIKTVRHVVAQAPFEKLLDDEIIPGRAVTSNEDIETWIRQCASLSHHLVGSCKMGPSSDPMAVVDPELCVHGIKRLRVIDASIMPSVTSANTHATTVAVAEKGADLIKAANGNTKLKGEMLR